MSEKKRAKKSGRIAVPFLVTIFVGLIIIGGFALWLWNYLDYGKEEKPPAPPARNTATATAEDNHTILFILDEPDKECSSTFVLMRSLPMKKKILFIGIPTNTISVIDGEQQSLAGSYERGDASAAVSFVQETLGVSIDRYMKFDSAAFKKICDIFGGVSYPVDVEIAGIRDGEAQQLNSEQIETFITYPLFKEGESERAFIAASVISSMVNQADGERIADGFDRNFDIIINMTVSDITSVDKKNRESAIKDMFRYGSSLSIAMLMDGTTSENDFIPSSNFIESLPDQYFED